MGHETERLFQRMLGKVSALCPGVGTMDAGICFVYWLVDPTVMMVSGANSDAGQAIILSWFEKLLNFRKLLLPHLLNSDNIFPFFIGLLRELTSIMHSKCKQAVPKTLDPC